MQRKYNDFLLHLIALIGKQPVDTCSINATRIIPVEIYTHIFFVTVFFLFISQYAFSQITFEKSYKNEAIYSGLGKTVIADGDGYFLSGLYYKKTENTISLYGSAIIRTNLYGDTLWTKTFPLETPYGNVLLITKSSPIEYVFVSNPSNPDTKSDIKVTKMDSLGNIIWSNTIVKPNNDESNQIIQTNDNGYLITGQTNSLPGITTPHPYDAYIIKLNSEGDTVWTKMVGDKDYNEYAYGAIETSDSHYLITGFQDGGKVLLLKMNINGDILWTKKYDSEAGYYNSAFDVAETKDKDYIIVGTKHQSGTANSDIYTMKVDKEGNVLWEKSYHINGNSSSSKVLVLDSCFLIAGENEGTAFLLKIGDEGNLLWSKTIVTFSDPLFPSGNGSVASIDKCNDGGFIFTNESSFSLTKTDAEGCVKPNTLPIVGESNVSITDSVVFEVNAVRGKTYTWKSTRGTILSGQGTDSIVISWDEVGLDSVKVFVENDCGIDSTALNINIQECVPLSISKIQSSNHYTEFYVDKYEGKKPTYLWSVDKGSILSGQNSNHIIVNWLEFGNVEISVKVTNDCSVFEDNMQIIISHLGNAVKVENADVKIYPNPAKNELRIDSYGLTVMKLEILDFSGKIINNQWYNGKSVNVSMLPQGIYFVKLKTDKGIITKKFVKE